MRWSLSCVCCFHNFEHVKTVFVLFHALVLTILCVSLQLQKGFQSFPRQKQPSLWRNQGVPWVNKSTLYMVWRIRMVGWGCNPVTGPLPGTYEGMGLITSITQSGVLTVQFCRTHVQSPFSVKLNAPMHLVNTGKSVVGWLKGKIKILLG